MTLYCSSLSLSYFSTSLIITHIKFTPEFFLRWHVWQILCSVNLFVVFGKRVSDESFAFIGTQEDPRFKSKAFLDEAKEFFSQMMNTQLSERSRMQVFPKNSPYMATRKIRKNNPKAAEIMAANELKAEWNQQMILAQASGVPRESMMKVKKRLITDPVRESKARAGGKSDPPAFQRIITGAIKVVSIMLKRSERYPKEKWIEAWGKALNEFMDACIQFATKRDIRQKTERSRSQRTAPV